MGSASAAVGNYYMRIEILRELLYLYNDNGLKNSVRKVVFCPLFECTLGSSRPFSKAHRADYNTHSVPLNAFEKNVNWNDSVA
jgi:hypothetical protein